MEKECKQCNKKFRGHKGSKYCSKKCYADFQRNIPKESHPRWRGGKINKECQECGGKFMARKESAKYCSQKCYANSREYSSGEDNFFWKGGKILKICPNCGKEFDVFQSRKDIKKFCSKNCYTEYAIGESHSAWRGGKSYEPYSTQWTDDLKDSIRKRDGYVCQECGIHQDELGRKLDVHHIDYDKDNLDPENLITLCVSCHGKTNFNREEWEKYFLSEEHPYFHYENIHHK